MSEAVDLTNVPPLPQADFLHQLAPALWQRSAVLGVWLEGSMGRGNADLYSDVDLYVGLEPAELEAWRTLDVAQLFGAHYAAHMFSNFAEDFFVYHVYLTDGGIYDLHIQPRSRTLPKAKRLILACRDEEYRSALLAAAPEPGAENELLFAPQPFDPATLAALLAGFWINADKGRKVLYRNQDLTCYTGLHLFRFMLVRLLFIEATGADCGDLTRPTIHGLKAAAAVLNPTQDETLGSLMGAAAMTKQELCRAQTLIYTEVARVGRALATNYGIAYPAALEEIVVENWQRFMEEMDIG
ncbi:MAG: nucleotidyltransferase domain-containing protein [Caldilineaceae bacterium]